MAFSFPCDLENIDVVLPMRYREKLYVTINDNEKLLNAEGDNGYAYVVAGTTVDNLKKSISHISTDDDELKDDDITEITALELLIRWRSFILDGKPTLVLGCEDYWCDTALCSPNGVLYPHPYSIVSYLVDKDGTPQLDEFGSLLCAGSQTQLLVTVLYKKQSLMEGFYKNELQIRAEPLLYLAERHKMINCEGSLCNVAMAIAHSSIARQKQNEEENV